jgi:hypothetical protein
VSQLLLLVVTRSEQSSTDGLVQRKLCVHGFRSATRRSLFWERSAYLELQIFEEVLVDEPLVGVHLGQGERVLEHVAHLVNAIAHSIRTRGPFSATPAV